MIVFCAFQQDELVIKYAQKHGFKNHYPIFFVKNYSAQVLKANMRIVGATEHALVFYRDKLPKFRGQGRMVFDWFKWIPDNRNIPKIHPTQKPVNLLKTLIQIFTDEGDVVIDPCAGSGSTLRAAHDLQRPSYGFEIDRNMCALAKSAMLNFENEQISLF